MSLDKGIKYGKEHRKPYYRAKAFDATCRNHGSCTWCRRNRLHKMRDKHPPEIPICPPCTQEEVDKFLSELHEAMKELVK